MVNSAAQKQTPCYHAAMSAQPAKLAKPDPVSDPDPDEELLNGDQIRLLVARRTRGGAPVPIHPSTLRRWRNGRLIPFVRISRTFYYPKRAVLKALQVAESACDVVELRDLLRLKKAADILDAMHKAGTSPRQILAKIEQRRRAGALADELREELGRWPLDQLD